MRKSLRLFLFLPLFTLIFLCTANAQTTPLTTGTLSATASPSGVTLALSASLSGGTSTGQGYKIYRDTQPAVSVTGTPFATVTGGAFSYTDNTAAAGLTYYYKVVAYDSVNTVNTFPAGLGSVSSSQPLSIAVTVPSGQFILVFIGDSITYGAGVSNGGSMLSPTFPYYCVTYFSTMSGIRSVVGTNQGHSGFTTYDWLPTVNTSRCFTRMESAVNALRSTYPNYQVVFIVRLGTNDSASTVTHNNPRGIASGASVAANDVTLGSRLLKDYPGSTLLLDHPTYYTPNTHNGAIYEEAGLAAMVGYFSYIDGAVATLNSTYAGRAYIGETTAFADFAANYLTLDQAERGVNGTFYLHPNGTAGTAELGRLEAAALFGALYSRVDVRGRR